jgi:hypothetical protein
MTRIGINRVPIQRRSSMSSSTWSCDEAELPLWVLAMKLAVALHRRPAIRARVDDRDPIEDPTIADAADREGLDHEH